MRKATYLILLFISGGRRAPVDPLAAPDVARHLLVAAGQALDAVVRAPVGAALRHGAGARLAHPVQTLPLPQHGVSPARHAQLRRLRAGHDGRGLRQEHARGVRRPALHKEVSRHCRHFLAAGEDMHDFQHNGLVLPTIDTPAVRHHAITVSVF